MSTDLNITPDDLQQRLRAFPPPAVIDVRRTPAFAEDPQVIAGALRRAPETIAEWARELEPWRPVVVYCVHGHNVSQDAAAFLQAAGFDARHLEGGLAGWRESGLPTLPFAPPARWVTRARPKIDRIACPWLIRRFIDPAAEFFYVPNQEVRAFAAANGATAVRRPGRHVHARWRSVQLRRLHPHPRARASCARRARDHRAGSRHVELAAGRAGAGPPFRFARTVRDVRRRPRDAEVGHARVRLALCLVPRGAVGDARLVSGKTARTGTRVIVAEAAVVAPPAPTRAEALAYWFRLGCLSFGGPAGQIALMHRELVDEKRWISERRFLHALNYCMVLPGPEAQQLATYIGWLMHRTWGGIVAGGLFVLPSLVVLIALSWLYMAYGNVPAVAGILYGVKPAVVAIVLQAAWRMGSRSLRHPVLWIIAALALIAIALLSVPFPAIVLSAGLAGYVGGRVAPAAFATGSAHSVGTGTALGIDHRRRHANSRPCALRVAAPGGRAGRLPVVVGNCAWNASRCSGTGFAAGADGLVLLEGGDAHVRRRLRRLALRLPGRGRSVRVADAGADDRRPGAGRNHARSADHGGGVRRICRRLVEAGVRAGRCCRSPGSPPRAS